MTKHKIERLIELIHLSYHDKFTDAEAIEFQKLKEEFREWGDFASKFPDIKTKIIGILNPGIIVTATLVWEKVGGQYYITVAIFRSIIKEMIKEGKAEKIKGSYKYQILK